jgi:hypothetical protein
MPVLSKKTLHLKERCLLLRGREFKTSIDQRGGLPKWVSISVRPRPSRAFPMLKEAHRS